MVTKKEFLEKSILVSSDCAECAAEADAGVGALKIVGRLFRLFRKSHNLTQADLAKRFHCSATYISCLENGNPGANLEQTLRLSHHIHFDFGLMLSCACKVSYFLPEDSILEIQDEKFSFGLLHYVYNSFWQPDRQTSDAQTPDGPAGRSEQAAGSISEHEPVPFSES